MDIVIVGAAGQGKVVLDILSTQTRWKPVGFLDDSPSLKDSQFCGFPVLGPASDLARLRKEKIQAAIIAIGNNRVRASLFQKARELGFRLPTVIHPSAVIAKDVSMGDGVQVSPGAVIVTGSRLGNNIVLNTSISVDHDCLVSDHCYIAPGAHLAGNVTVGPFTWVGMGANVLQGLKIGTNVLLGAGSVLLSDAEDDTVIVGVPGRVLRRQEKIGNSSPLMGEDQGGGDTRSSAMNPSPSPLPQGERKNLRKSTKPIQF
ncbi:MAG: acetyltransferase [Elusimicrobia bacterium]|nr:acetyltransferase [Elusimicrobiota bacterium]